MDKDSEQYRIVKNYDGKYCRVFLANATRLNGYITLVDNWIVVRQPNKKQCIVQLPYVISISEYVPSEQ